MPLCTRCRSEAHVTVNVQQRGGTRPTDTSPPHGMEWGEQCDRCDLTAEVTIQ